MGVGGEVVERRGGTQRRAEELRVRTEGKSGEQRKEES